MESKRTQDEKKDSGKKLRQHERSKCVVSIEYDIDDWSYLSVVKIGRAHV